MMLENPSKLASKKVATVLEKNHPEHKHFVLSFFLKFGTTRHLLHQGELLNVLIAELLNS